MGPVSIKALAEGAVMLCSHLSRDNSTETYLDLRCHLATSSLC